MEHDPRPKQVPLNAEELHAIRKNPRLLNESTYKPQITKLTRSPPVAAQVLLNGTPNPRLGKIPKTKFSSTSTMFLNQENNVLTPGVADVLRCIATALHFNMVQQRQGEGEKLPTDIWSETAHPLGDGRTNLVEIPSTDEILFFLETVWDGQALSAESAVMCLAYIDRFVALTGIVLIPANWRRITLAAAILASKVWEDLAVWNADFLALFPCLKVTDLNRLEREMLMALEFVVGLKASMYVERKEITKETSKEKRKTEMGFVTSSPHRYAKYYFDLRTLSEKSDINFPLDPLTIEQGKKLEHKSQGLEDEERQERFKAVARSKSLDPVVLASYMQHKEKG
eukprot:TRINITY_DN2639_c0_g1_i2.p1 TRINITY_DN2639_c0_g1~~TRINITY_DN2639_c0_g1_i2.p1  ORF type:complete len:341 (+),score=74.33 TRINITY_DN2639_c0_g1_i2:13-1035(+)